MGEVTKRTQKVEERTKNTKERFLEALKKSLGIVSVACDNVGIVRNTYYRWLTEDSDFKDKVDDIMEYQKDFVETQFFKNIKNGNAQAQTFYLRTKAKDRGYAERTEITGKDGKDLIPENKMSVEELEKEIERLRNKEE